MLQRPQYAAHPSLINYYSYLNFPPSMVMHRMWPEFTLIKKSGWPMIAPRLSAGISKSRQDTMVKMHYRQIRGKVGHVQGLPHDERLHHGNTVSASVVRGGSRTHNRGRRWIHEHAGTWYVPGWGYRSARSRPDRDQWAFR